MGQRWYLLGKRGEHGPVDARALRQYADERRISPTTKVRREEDTEYRRAGTIRGLFAEQNPTAAVENPDPERSNVSPLEGRSKGDSAVKSKPTVDPQTVDPQKARKLFYVVDADQQERGPYTIAQLKELAVSRRIHPGSRLRNIDLPMTNSARRVRGLFSDEEIAAYERQERQERQRKQAAVPAESAPPVARPTLDHGATARVRSPMPKTESHPPVVGEAQPAAAAPPSPPAEQWVVVEAAADTSGTYTRAQLAQLAARKILKPDDRVRRLADGREVMAVRIPTVFPEEVVAAVRQRAQEEAAARRAHQEEEAAAKQRQAEHDRQMAEERAQAQRQHEAAQAKAEAEAAAVAQAQAQAQEQERQRAAAQLAAPEPEPLRPEPAAEVTFADDHPSDDGHDDEDVDFAQVAESLSAPEADSPPVAESAEVNRGTDRHESAVARGARPPRQPARQSLPRPRQKPLSQTFNRSVLEQRWHEWDAQRHRTESADLHRVVRGSRLPGSPNWEVDDPGAGLGIVPRCRRRVVHALALPDQQGESAEMRTVNDGSDYDREEDV